MSFAPPSAIAASLQRGTEATYGQYRDPVRINGRPGSGIYGGVRYTGPQTDGGFKSDSDVVLRILKSAWPALRDAQEVSKARVELPLGKNRSWLTYRVDANAPVIDNHDTGEWILHLDYLHSV